MLLIVFWSSFPVTKELRSPNARAGRAAAAGSSVSVGAAATGGATATAGDGVAGVGAGGAGTGTGAGVLDELAAADAVSFGYEIWSATESGWSN